MITIRAGDWENNVADIARMPVIFDCNDDRDRPSFGEIYTPTLMERVGEVVNVTGWAIDFDQVEEVEIWMDGEYLAHADEIRLPSPEIDEIYLWLPNYFTQNARWRYDMDTVALNITDGEHVMVVWTEDHWGGRTMIGERVFVVDNLGKSATAKVALN